MKNIKWFLSLIFVLLILSVGCEKEDDLKTEDIIPSSFKIDVPDCISNATNEKSLKGDIMGGGEIYGHLRNFLWIGESAAEIIEDIIISIGQNELSQAMSFSFTGEDDGKTKNVVITENSSFEGIDWEYQLTMTDADSEGNADGGVAMQVFWNTDPVKGIAILKPKNLDVTDVSEWSVATFRIDYSEAEEYGYEKHMIVYITDLPTTEVEIYAMSSLKMFVGKNGDIVNVYGNSNHPYAKFHFGADVGFNWAFVASGNEVLDIGVAEVGLPPSLLDETSRKVLLEDYSVFNVFSSEIAQWFLASYGYDIPQTILDGYLANAKAPAYFNNGGFVGAGVAPSGEYAELEENIKNLCPYNPIRITNLVINFKIDQNTK